MTIIIVNMGDVIPLCLPSAGMGSGAAGFTAGEPVALPGRLPGK